MAKNEIKVSAKVADTVRPSVAAGAKQHPAWQALRSVAERVTTPLLPDDYLKLANPLWSARELRGRVLDVRRETVDSATLVIKPGWGFSFDYEPGQYVGIGVLVDGRWRWRSYSLTSVPDQPRVRSGITQPSPSRSRRCRRASCRPTWSAASHRARSCGWPLPQGNFVMPDPAPASVLFLTAGSGITPVMSMLRTLAKRDQIGDIVHLHSAPTESDVIFARSWRSWRTAHAGYRLRLRATSTQGRLDLSRLGDEVPDWRARQTWACGPGGHARRRAPTVVGRGRGRAAPPRTVRGVARRRCGAPAAR